MRQARRRGLRNKIIFRSRQKRFLHICVIHISFYVCDVLYENVLLYIVNVHTSYTWYVYIDTLRKQNNDSNGRLTLMRSITIIYSFYCYLSYYLTSGPVHTETFACVFVLFTVNSCKQFIVLKGIENNQRITWNNTKTQENVSVCTGSEFQALVRVHSSKFKLNRLSLYRPDLVVICKVAHIQRCIHIPRLRIILKSYRFTSDIDFPLFRQLSCKNQPGRCILYVVRRSHGRRSSAWTSKTLGALECDHISIWRASA